MADVHPGVVGLNGGRKQFWLRVHRGDVLEYLGQHGVEATKAYFQLGDATYERFLRAREVKIEGLSTSERALMISKHSIELSRATKQELRELAERVAELEPVVAVGRAVLAAVAQGVMAEARRERLGVAGLELNDFGKSGSK